MNIESTFKFALTFVVESLLISLIVMWTGHLFNMGWDYNRCLVIAIMFCLAQIGIYLLNKKYYSWWRNGVMIYLILLLVVQVYQIFVNNPL